MTSERIGLISQLCVCVATITACPIARRSANNVGKIRLVAASPTRCFTLTLGISAIATSRRLRAGADVRMDMSRAIRPIKASAANPTVTMRSNRNCSSCGSICLISSIRSSTKVMCYHTQRRAFRKYLFPDRFYFPFCSVASVSDARLKVSGVLERASGLAKKSFFSSCGTGARRNIRQMAKPVKAR